MSVPNPGSTGGRAFELDSEVCALREAIAQAFNIEGVQMVNAALDASMAFLQRDGIISVRVALLLLRQHADAYVTAAILLGPVWARGQLTRAHIESTYGAEVATLVEKAQCTSPAYSHTGLVQHEEYAEFLRATVDDLRALVARVATRIIDLELPGSRSEVNCELWREKGESCWYLCRIGLASVSCAAGSRMRVSKSWSQTRTKSFGKRPCR